MTTSADGDSDFLGLGVFEGDSNIFLGGGLDEKCWTHAVIVLVAGRGILVVESIIVGCASCDLDACDVGDKSCGFCSQ